jgi:hypothetical protein
MTNEEFITYLESELTKSLMNTKAGKPDDKQKFRTEGLMQSAKLLKILSAEQLLEMMEQEHIKIFGESIDTRKARRSQLADLKENSPDKYFDIPTIHRTL